MLFVRHCTNHLTLVTSLNPQDYMSVKFCYYTHFRVEDIEAKLFAQNQVARKGQNQIQAIGALAIKHPVMS